VSNRDGNYEIYVINVDGTGLTRLTYNRGADISPVWSPDGTKIAFMSVREGRSGLYIMNADGSDPRFVTTANFGIELPLCRRSLTWSPDGTRIAFATYVPHPGLGGLSAIYMVNSDGTGLTRLTWGEPPLGPLDLEPAWSPDGTKIAFSSASGGYRWGICLMDPDGSDIVRLTDGLDWSPAWSPDGKRIAFVRGKGGVGDIYVMDADGTNIIRLTSGPAKYAQPSWSPDGEKIAFVSDRDKIFEVYVMDADGGNIRKLTDNPAYGFIENACDQLPSWFPLPYYGYIHYGCGSFRTSVGKRIVWDTPI